MYLEARLILDRKILCQCLISNPIRIVEDCVVCCSWQLDFPYGNLARLDICQVGPQTKQNAMVEVGASPNLLWCWAVLAYTDQISYVEYLTNWFIWE